MSDITIKKTTAFILQKWGVDSATIEDAGFGALNSAELDELTPILSRKLQELETGWLSQQAQKWLLVHDSLEDKLIQIASFVIGELDSQASSQVRELINTDPDCQVFYNICRQLWQLIERVDWPVPTRTNSSKIGRFQNDSFPNNLGLVLRKRTPLRGGNFSISLNAPEDDGFQIRLTIIEVDQESVNLRGRFIPTVDSKTSNLVNAKVWMIPKAHQPWSESTVSETFSFRMPNIKKGIYDFEMVWGDEDFLEFQNISLQDESDDY